MRTVNGEIIIPNSQDRLIVYDVSDDELKEVLFENLTISAVAITQTVGKTNTLSFYSDLARTQLINTIEINDGADGAGNTIPNWDSGRIFEINEMCISDEGSLVRSIGGTNQNNVPPLYGDDAEWEMIHRKTDFIVVTAASIIADAFVIQQGMEIYADTSAALITMTVAADVTEFTIHDYERTFTEALYCQVDLGSDQLRFGLSIQGGSIRFIRIGATFRAYTSDGSIIAGDI